MAGVHIQHAPQAHHQVGPGGRAVLGHPHLLLGGPQADKDHVGLGLADGLHHRPVLLEVAVVGAAHRQAGVGLAQVVRRLVRHPGLGPQEEEPPPRLGQPGQQAGGKVNPRHPLLQGGTQDLGGVDHPDAVGEDQPGAVEDLAVVLPLPGQVDDLRVGGHHIGKAGAGRQALSGVHGFGQGQVVKQDTHDVVSHSVPSPWFPCSRGRNWI